MNITLDELQKVENIINDYVPSSQGSTTMKKISKMIFKLSFQCDDVYISEKLNSIKNWAEILTHPRKYKQYGAVRLKNFINMDISSIRKHYDYKTASNADN